MIVQRVIRSVGRWLTRHQWAGSCGKGTEAHTNQRGNFDRFTERARTVMQFAQEEAQRLQHNYIGTEHLLLGLLRERAGVGGRVLTRLRVDLDQSRPCSPAPKHPRKSKRCTARSVGHTSSRCTTWPLALTE